MNARWFALALIALLIGFGVGFISSYLIFQQQIAALRMEIKELQEQLFDLKFAYSNISTLSEMQNNLNELRSVLSDIILLLQQVLNKEHARIEKLEFTSAYAAKLDAEFSVTLLVKNTGFSDTMIQTILINGKLDGNAKVNSTSLSSTFLGIPVKVGQTVSLIITLPASTYVSGQTIEIIIQTAVGNQYPKTIVLP